MAVLNTLPVGTHYSNCNCSGNKCVLDFKGESGGDIFVSRAWVLAVPEVYNETLEFVGIDGGDGTDITHFIGSVGDDRFVFEDDAFYGGKENSDIIATVLCISIHNF